MTRPARLACLALLLLLPSGPVQAGADRRADAETTADGPPDGSLDAEVPREESLFGDLTESFDGAVLAARSDPSFDEVVLIEAEEIALVADELLAEGDTVLAVELLEEAIALLGPVPAD